MQIARLDHLVLTVRNLDVSVDFYVRVLGMSLQTFDKDRKALRFGRQKINLHESGKEFEPKAHHPTPGSADLCFVVETPLQEVVDHVRGQGARFSWARSSAREPRGRWSPSISATRTGISSSCRVTERVEPRPQESAQAGAKSEHGRT